MHLATTRLTLREAAIDDACALATYQRNARYLEHYSGPPGADRIIQLARQWAAESPRLNYQLIVTLGTKGPVIGCAGLRQADHPPGEAEVGIELNPDHWGSGYAREALSKLIEFARKNLGLQRLIALTAPENHRAHQLVRSFGFSLDSSSDHETRFQLILGAA